MPRVPSKEKHERLDVKDVYLVYTDVVNPKPKYYPEGTPIPEPMSDHPMEKFNLTLGIILGEKRFEETFRKKFKTTQNIKNAKEDISPELAHEKYHLPMEIAVTEPSWAVVFFRQSVLMGPPAARVIAKSIPVYGIKKDLADNYFDQEKTHITQNTALGNGTLAHVQLMPVLGKFGLYIYPFGICVKKLVEFASNRGLDLETDSLAETIDEVIAVAPQTPDVSTLVSGSSEDAATDDVASDDDFEVDNSQMF